MEYLDKVVLCVGIAMGSVLPVRTNKVVAGLEPEQTNVFLQQLAPVRAEAAGHSLDGAYV